MRVGGCPVVVAQWQSTGSSTQSQCPGFIPGSSQPFHFLASNVSLYVISKPGQHLVLIHACDKFLVGGSAEITRLWVSNG